MPHNSESLAAEDLSAGSPLDVADFVIDAIDHILADFTVPSGIYQQLEAIKIALETVVSES